MENKKSFTKKTSICVLGGGAAGLSAAYYLQKQGYENVTVLEKSGRIGGKCDSITYKGKSFDLGANYITSSYTQVRKLAKEVGAGMYTEGSLNAFDVKNKKLTSLYKAVTAEASFFTITWKSICYLWKRWRLNKIFKTPGFGQMSKHKELTVSFKEWLVNNGLSSLETLFEIPLTCMGYGVLDKIPAAYALTYMRMGTYIDLLLAAISPRIIGWPKRFTEGYGRFWERISWKLNVKTGVDVKKVERSDLGVKVHYRITQQDLNKVVESEIIEENFDHIIIATPLSVDVLEQFLELSDTEKKTFGKIMLDPFVIVTYESENLEELTAATFMVPTPPLGTPFGVTRQFKENNLVEFYSRTDREGKIRKEDILKANRAWFEGLPGENHSMNKEHYTYDEWPYFPHVSSEEMYKDGTGQGFYDIVESWQGKDNTFFVGGIMAFELVEPIVEYSKNLVETHFPKI
jgi:hypothetical protein